MKTLAILALTFTLVCSAFSQGTPLTVPPPSPKELEEWAAMILPPNGGDGHFRKWATAPRITLCGRAATSYRSICEKFVADAATCLDGLNVVPTLVDDNSFGADIVVVIGDTATLNTYRQREHANAGVGWHAVYGANSKTIKHFAIFADTNTFKNPVDTNERRMLYVLLMRSLGLSGDNTYPIVSLWGRFNEGTQEDALWENDRKLLRFAYQFVPNYSTKNDVRLIVRKAWN